MQSAEVKEEVLGSQISTDVYSKILLTHKSYKSRVFLNVQTKINL